MNIKYIAFAFLLVNISTLAQADSKYTPSNSEYFLPTQAHAGQMDTDGILSEGEVRNPNIDYDHAQRRAEHHDDERVDNPYNEDAAADERERKERAHDDFNRDEHDRDRPYRDDRDDHRNRGDRW